MRFSVINVLWVICSSPILLGILFTIAAINQTDNAENVAALVRLMFLYCGVLSPFLLFPAVAAMFTVARKWVTGDVDVPLFKTYFKGYKENYLQSMMGGILFVIIGTVTYINYLFYVRQSGTLGLLSILFIVISFIVLAAMFHFFSIMVHFHMKFWQIMKNSMLITIGNPVMTIFLLVGNGLIVYISIYHFTFLIPFFMGSLMAFVSFWTFFRIFDRMKSLAESKEQEKETEEAVEAEAADVALIGDGSGEANEGSVRTAERDKPADERKEDDDSTKEERRKPLD